MIKVYTSEDMLEAGLLKSILEEEGIACLIKNQNLSGALGEIPPLECWPEIWITHDDDFIKAGKIVEAILQPGQQDLSAWLCECGESIEPQFTACWHCNRERSELCV